MKRKHRLNAIVIGLTIVAGAVLYIHLTSPGSRSGSADAKGGVEVQRENRPTRGHASSGVIGRLSSEEPRSDGIIGKSDAGESGPLGSLAQRSGQWADELERFLEGDAEAFDRFLAGITTDNWREARAALARAFGKGGESERSSGMERFWRRVGEVGGEEVARELIEEINPDFVSALKGWGEADPQGLFDFFSELDIREDPEIQRYLEATNTRELPFIDQFTDGILRGLLEGLTPESITDAEANQIGEMIDFFMESDPRKAQSLMREFTERIISPEDREGLQQWVASFDEPIIQAAAVQRVIESGAFDDDPSSAVSYAWSLEMDQSRRVALSAAYARLAAGTDGHDPNVTASELMEMNHGLDRDFAINGFAHGLVRSDPGAALEWANAIDNENFRQVVVGNISKRINRQ